jgi:hypothetical protein
VYGIHLESEQAVNTILDGGVGGGGVVGSTGSCSEDNDEVGNSFAYSHIFQVYR